MKRKLMTLMIALILVFSTITSVFAKSNISTKNNTNINTKSKFIKIDEKNVVSRKNLKGDGWQATIITLKTNNQTNTSLVSTDMSTQNSIDEVVIDVIAFGVSRQFLMTQHALERLEERFYGSYDLIIQALSRGDIYIDSSHGGYIAYLNGTAVSLGDDLYTIKTVMDNVSIWDKIKYAVWQIFESCEEFLWSL
jgi:hypothetical protein